MLAAAIGLYAFGLSTALLGLRWPFLAVLSAGVMAAYGIHAALSGTLSLGTLFGAYALSATLQGGYLACIAMDLMASELHINRVRLMREVKALAAALALAAGAFLLTMAKDPPRSAASDPAGAMADPVDIQVPTGIPTGKPNED